MGAKQDRRREEETSCARLVTVNRHALVNANDNFAPDEVDYGFAIAA